MHYRASKRSKAFPDMRVKVLRCLAIKHRWCKAAEIVRLIQELKGDDEYSYVRDRAVYPHLHALVEMGFAQARTSGGGEVCKRYEFCITEEGLRCINQIDPIQQNEYETTEMPSGTGELTGADYAFIHSRMNDDMRRALNWLANAEEGVWNPPRYVAHLFNWRRESRVLADLAEVGVIDQVEWSRNVKPSYRYRINNTGLGYLDFVTSQDNKGAHNHGKAILLKP